MEYFLLIIGAMFTNNFVLSQFLGCCPFLGVSKKTDTALGMGLAVTFVMGVASIITSCRKCSCFWASNICKPLRLFSS